MNEIVSNATIFGVLPPAFPGAMLLSSFDFFSPAKETSSLMRLCEFAGVFGAQKTTHHHRSAQQRQQQSTHTRTRMNTLTFIGRTIEKRR